MIPRTRVDIVLRLFGRDGRISGTLTAPATASPDLSALIIPLLKGVIYQEADAGVWNALLSLQARVRDYVAGA